MTALARFLHHGRRVVRNLPTSDAKRRQAETALQRIGDAFFDESSRPTTDALTSAQQEAQRRARVMGASSARVGDGMLMPQSIGKALAMQETWEGELRPRLDAFIEELKPLVPRQSFALGAILDPDPGTGDLDLGRVWDGISKAVDQAAKKDLAALTPPAGGALNLGRTSDSVRSQIHSGKVIGTFTTPPSNADLNARFAAHWAKPRTSDAASKPTSSGPPSAAEMNETNRRFWERRKG